MNNHPINPPWRKPSTISPHAALIGSIPGQKLFAMKVEKMSIALFTLYLTSYLFASLYYLLYFCRSTAL
uniref:Uncharacterized protein n=1 Tax=Heterorhabditis bacteriophora TaxID=37862 RepID=A0A1I7WV95_HETBA